ncbi:MAG: DUF1549 and DUF1553 domain-containing protein [Bryobacteraceae bacterium]|nr:DUF1549 and DUF1553 domain-containing protein [Bryobacteraceae bacterium]
MRFRKPALFAAVAASAALLLASESKPKEFTALQKRWWSFQPIAKTAPPAVQNRSAVKNDIDAFIVAKLEAKGIRPNSTADKITLLRRASLDLTGLPPTPEEAQAFLADNSPNAWANQIDRLLNSPRYGERWARHWLDLARYADSEGFKSDETRPNIWRYRDYVINSFNADKPYDRFVKEQIAGDEIYPNDPQAVIATGFNRHFPDESNARNLMQRRQELLFDVTDVVGSTFMGLTVGCAKCHDHKFDPILQKDYYRLQAFFSNTRIEDNLVLADGERRRQYEAKYSVWDARTAAIRGEMSKLVEPVRKQLWKDGFDKFPPEIQDSITTEPEKRTPIQWHMYYKARPQVEIPEETAAKKLKGPVATRYAALAKELKTFDDIKPAGLPVAQTMIDNASAPPKTHVLKVGVYNAYQEEVEPGFLTLLDGGAPAKIEKPASVNSSGRRTALANWLADPKNPLTARVMVNRIWHYHFGRGLSGNPSDFGLMGERPSHPELLDYLAATFIENGWSIKKMHRMILLSNTYQLSSAYDESAARLDSGNRLLWRFGRRRLEGETVRDAMLAVSGKLNLKMHGPGVFPPLPPGVITRGGWKMDEDESEANRRSVYVFVRRNTRYPMFEAFDMPDTHESCARRNMTTSAGQALELMNNELVLDWSRSLAARVSNDAAGMSPQSQIERAYKLVYSRTPNAAEVKAAEAFLERHDKVTGNRQTTLVDFCHMLLNSNEFLYLN